MLPKKSHTFSLGRVFSVCKKEQINYQYINNEFGFYFDFIRTSIDNINVTRNVTIYELSVDYQKSGRRLNIKTSVAVAVANVLRLLVSHAFGNFRSQNPWLRPNPKV